MMAWRRPEWWGGSDPPTMFSLPDVRRWHTCCDCGGVFPNMSDLVAQRVSTEFYGYRDGRPVYGPRHDGAVCWLCHRRGTFAVGWRDMAEAVLRWHPVQGRWGRIRWWWSWWKPRYLGLPGEWVWDGSRDVYQVIHSGRPGRLRAQQVSGFAIHHVMRGPFEPRDVAEVAAVVAVRDGLELRPLR